MHHCYIALSIYYAIPGVPFTVLYWWETDLIMGSRSAYWQERFDLRHIVASIVAGAVWPLVGLRLAWSVYMRWPVGEKLLAEIEELRKEVKRLKTLVSDRTGA